jgi:hypothetical protein
LSSQSPKRVGSVHAAPSAPLSAHCDPRLLHVFLSYALIPPTIDILFCSACSCVRVHLGHFGFHEFNFFMLWHVRAAHSSNPPVRRHCRRVNALGGLAAALPSTNRVVLFGFFPLFLIVFALLFDLPAILKFECVIHTCIHVFVPVSSSLLQSHGRKARGKRARRGQRFLCHYWCLVRRSCALSRAFATATARQPERHRKARREARRRDETRRDEASPVKGRGVRWLAPS